MIDVYHCHSLLNANYVCTLAALPLLTTPVCTDILVFTLSAVLSALSNCVFNSFVFSTHKHRLFQNISLLSPETNLHYVCLFH